MQNLWNLLGYRKSLSLTRVLFGSAPNNRKWGQVAGIRAFSRQIFVSEARPFSPQHELRIQLIVARNNENLIVFNQ
jgi:hypothetical protein